jgi:hypothetical protein
MSVTGTFVSGLGEGKTDLDVETERSPIFDGESVSLIWPSHD